MITQILFENGKIKIIKINPLVQTKGKGDKERKLLQETHWNSIVRVGVD